MSAKNWNINDPRCEATKRGGFVDALPWNGVVTVLLTILPTKAADASVMHKSDQITG